MRVGIMRRQILTVSIALSTYNTEIKSFPLLHLTF